MSSGFARWARTFSPALQDLGSLLIQEYGSIGSLGRDLEPDGHAGQTHIHVIHPSILAAPPMRPARIGGVHQRRAGPARNLEEAK